MLLIIFTLLILTTLWALNVDKFFVQTIKMTGGSSEKFHKKLDKLLNEETFQVKEIQKRLEIICHYSKFKKKCIKLSKLIYRPIGPKAIDCSPYAPPALHVLKSINKMRISEMMLDYEKESVYIMIKINFIISTHSQLRDHCKLYQEIYSIRGDKARYKLFSEGSFYLNRLDFISKIIGKLEQLPITFPKEIFRTSHGMLVGAPPLENRQISIGRFRYFPKQEFELFLRLITSLQRYLPEVVCLEKESWKKFIMSLTFYSVSCKVSNKDLMPNDLLTTLSGIAFLQGSLLLLERCIVSDFDYFGNVEEFVYLEVFDNIKKEIPLMIGALNASIEETISRYVKGLEIKGDAKTKGINVITSNFLSKPQVMLSFLKSIEGCYHVIIPKWIFEEFDRDLLIIKSLFQISHWEGWNDLYQSSLSFTSILQDEVNKLAAQSKPEIARSDLPLNSCTSLHSLGEHLISMHSDLEKIKITLKGLVQEIAENKLEISSAIKTL